VDEVWYLLILIFDLSCSSVPPSHHHMTAHHQDKSIQPILLISSASYQGITAQQHGKSISKSSWSSASPSHLINRTSQSNPPTSYYHITAQQLGKLISKSSRSSQLHPYINRTIKSIQPTYIILPHNSTTTWKINQQIISLISTPSLHQQDN
jgi:hypothetical protein